MIWEIDEQKPAIEGLDAHGRPDPAYAAALGLLRAPFGRRSLAFAIDVAIWVVVLVPLLIGAAPLLLRFAAGSISAYGFVNHPDFVLAVVMASASTLLALVLLIVQLVLHGRRGVTIGKAATGIRSVDVRTLERPRVGPVLLRFLLLIASGIVPVVGPAFLLASPTFDPERRGRGLHDKATGVWLIDARRGLDPYDQKRMRVARKVVKAEPTPGRAALPSLATPTDPAAQPEYRPGGRVSAGVLGMARPHETSVRPSVGLPPIAPATAPEPAEAGKPVLGGYRGSGRQTAPAAPAPQSAAPAPQPAAPAPQPEPVVRFGLRWDSGESMPIAAPVLLGRNPDAAEHPGATAIALADDSRSLSKTHLLVRPVPGGLEIVDCRSTNGSGLIRGGTEYGVAAGTPTTATEGDMIRLGDRVAAVVRL
jgi:uncharacterized RDD family membrane protein YckC